MSVHLQFALLLYTLICSAAAAVKPMSTSFRLGLRVAVISSFLIRSRNVLLWHIAKIKTEMNSWKRFFFFAVWLLSVKPDFPHAKKALCHHHVHLSVLFCWLQLFFEVCANQLTANWSSHILLSEVLWSKTPVSVRFLKRSRPLNDHCAFFAVTG